MEKDWEDGGYLGEKSTDLEVVEGVGWAGGRGKRKARDDVEVSHWAMAGR